ncbi:MAG: hypothetical protein ACI4M9_00250 [Succinivibrio sp.]
MKLLNIFAALVMASAVFGCTSKDVELGLEKPAYIEEQSINGPKICVADVTDNRIFNGSIEHQDRPSGVVLSADYKSRVYGRLKNMLGDYKAAVMLPKGQTLSGNIREIIERAFRECGYQIVPVSQADDPDTMIAAVSIKNFWTWTEDSDSNKLIHSDIELDVYVQDGDNQKHLALKNRQTRKTLMDSKGQYQTTTSQSLQNIYHLAVEKFRSQL